MLRYAVVFFVIIFLVLCAVSLIWGLSKDRG